MSSDDPRPLTQADLVNGFSPRAVRPSARAAADLTPEERDEREAFARRVAEFERVAARAKALNGGPVNLAVQAETRAGLDRIWRSNAPTRAAERGVPARPDVRRIALATEPPAGDALDAVRAWLAWRDGAAVRQGSERVPAVLVLLSTAGGGKTSAASWAVTWHRESALYTTAAHVAASPLTAHSDSRGPWSALCAADLLVVDEIGREGGDRGPAALQALYLERDSRGRATILLGNRTPREFHARYVAGDEAIASRFAQQRAAGFEPVVAFAGRDLRLPFGDGE